MIVIHLGVFQSRQTAMYSIRYCDGSITVTGEEVAEQRAANGLPLIQMTDVSNKSPGT